MSHERDLLERLLKWQRIESISPILRAQRLAAELTQLKNLQSHSEDYLNIYDQLFRYISIWLLMHDCDLTNHQAHQALREICLVHCPHLQIDKMIRQRHQLQKQRYVSEDKASFMALKECLSEF